MISKCKNNLQSLKKEMGQNKVACGALITILALSILGGGALIALTQTNLLDLSPMTDLTGRVIEHADTFLSSHPYIVGLGVSALGTLLGIAVFAIVRKFGPTNAPSTSSSQPSAESTSSTWNENKINQHNERTKKQRVENKSPFAELENNHAYWKKNFNEHKNQLLFPGIWYQNWYKACKKEGKTKDFPWHCRVLWAMGIVANDTRMGPSIQARKQPWWPKVGKKKVNIESIEQLNTVYPRVYLTEEQMNKKNQFFGFERYKKFDLNEFVKVTNMLLKN